VIGNVDTGSHALPFSGYEADGEEYGVFLPAAIDQAELITQIYGED
jgi:hypothetical protein